MKRDLYFSKPIMNAAGILGFAPDPRADVPLDSFGAFVTNPISMRPRLPASSPSMIPFAGGFLLHTGLPNAGFSSVIKKHTARWNHSNIPIIVHLIADDPDETRQMIRALEEIENVMAVELGFAPHTPDDAILKNLQMCLGEIPLIFSLPAEQILSLGTKLIQRGADAIGMATPRGAIIDAEKHLVTGRLYGQANFPRALEIIHSAKRISLPIIGAGAWDEKDAAEMLAVGAMAAQIDVSLWKPKLKSGEPNDRSMAV